MTTFALVHGGWFGSWCWERLVPHLRDLGDHSVLVDLPCEDPNADLGDYTTVVVSACAAIADPVVVVGHSLAGMTIPLVPDLRPVQRLVFLCSAAPHIGRSYADMMTRENFGTPGVPIPWPDEDGTSQWINKEQAVEAMFHDCTSDDAEWAFRQLRSNCNRPMMQSYPLNQWPDVPSSSILGRDDRVVDARWSRRAAREQLGTTARELPGGHAPFIARPKQLARLLHNIAA